MNWTLEMLDINKSFPGVQALSNARLDLKRGEVLGLIGENGAGKSTLMNILSGVFLPDSGEIILKGKRIVFHNPNDALKAGISMIHQEICLVPELSVAENIWINREEKFSKFGIINLQLMEKATNELMSKFGIVMDCKKSVSKLSIAEMQMVEIIRAISFDSEIIIMDEPTSALTNREIDILFNIIKRLKENDVSFIFISHKIDELINTCDRITIMRDSKFINTVKTTETSVNDLISMMVGRDLKNLFQKQVSVPGDVVLELKNFSREGYFNNINIKLHRGEILGVSGLIGAGRSEIMRGLFGIDKVDDGEVLIDGKKVKIKSPKDAIKNGLAMVTEDRALSGLVLGMRITHNITIVILKYLTKLGFIKNRKESLTCAEMIEKLQIKISNEKQLTNQLSGGNQQKVVLSKWLLTNPKILILDEPTRGIDVGSKSEIYKLMGELTACGIGIIMISSELPEILGMSDRILVLKEGRLAWECNREDANQELIMEYAFGNMG